MKPVSNLFTHGQIQPDSYNMECSLRNLSLIRIANIRCMNLIHSILYSSIMIYQSYSLKTLVSLLFLALDWAV